MTPSCKLFVPRLHLKTITKINKLVGGKHSVSWRIWYYFKTHLYNVMPTDTCLILNLIDESWLHRTVGWIAENAKQRYKTIMIAIVQHLFLQRVPRSSSRSTFICFTHQVHQPENVIFQLTFWYNEEVTSSKYPFPRVPSRCFPVLVVSRGDIWAVESVLCRIGQDFVRIN